jgi:thiol-disulfide isomerase/thioredoxin
MATSTSFLGALRGLPGRIGQVLLSPRDALERVDREGGGLTDALWLIALGTVTFRFAQLLEALLGLTEPAGGALFRVVAPAADELVGAAWVVLPAAVVITLLAGARRDSSRDVELGATCYVPYFAVRAVFRAIDAVAGARALPPLAPEIAAGAAALPAFIHAVLIARNRTGAFPAPVIVQPQRRAFIAGLVLAALASVGLAGNAAWASRHLPSLLPIRHGQVAPTFTLERADGKPGHVALAELRGQVVVLDFWATWCPPCLAMLPTMHELNAEWSPRGVTFVGVNSDGGIEPEALKAFLREHDVPYPVVLDEGEVNRLYKVRALPQLIVVGKDGTIRKTFLGFTRKAAIASALEEAAAAAP